MRKIVIILSTVFFLLLFEGCGKEKIVEKRLIYEATGTSEVLGVGMNVEKSVYPSNVSEINVVWTNDTDKEYMFGEPFSILKKEVEEWKPVGNSEAVFTSIGYPVAAHSQRKHKYNLRIFVDELERGEYQIVTSFLDVRAPGDYSSYKVSTNFSVE